MGVDPLAAFGRAEAGTIEEVEHLLLQVGLGYGRVGGRSNGHGCSTAAPVICPARSFDEDFICFAQRKHAGVRPDARLRRDLEKLDPVAARQVGDRKQLPLLPEDVVRERGNVRHVNAGAHHAAALAHGAQRQRNEIAHRRENNRGVERHRRLILR